jgi:hypothetical protein
VSDSRASDGRVAYGFFYFFFFFPAMIDGNIASGIHLSLLSLPPSGDGGLHHTCCEIQFPSLLLDAAAAVQLLFRFSPM